MAAYRNTDPPNPPPQEPCFICTKKNEVVDVVLMKDPPFLVTRGPGPVNVGSLMTLDLICNFLGARWAKKEIKNNKEEWFTETLAQMKRLLDYCKGGKDKDGRMEIKDVQMVFCRNCLNVFKELDLLQAEASCLTKKILMRKGKMAGGEGGATDEGKEKGQQVEEKTTDKKTTEDQPKPRGSRGYNFGGRGRGQRPRVPVEESDIDNENFLLSFLSATNLNKGEESLVGVGGMSAIPDLPITITHAEEVFGEEEANKGTKAPSLQMEIENPFAVSVATASATASGETETTLTPPVPKPRSLLKQ